MNLLKWIHESQDAISVLMLVLEVIGAVLVIVTLQKDKKIKQAEFIMNYNFAFISSEPLIEMELKLENCYQIYKQMESNEGKQRQMDLGKYKELLEKFKNELKPLVSVPENNGKVDEEYQKLINYLVYLESFAPLILTGQVDLRDIDDTFGYRYFIAMNNPVVQSYELLTEADYYNGCIQLYKKWYDYRKKHDKEIPMEVFSLSNTAGIDVKCNPVYCSENGEMLLNSYLKSVNQRKGIFR